MKKTFLATAAILSSLVLMGASCVNRQVAQPGGEQPAAQAAIKLATNARVGEYFTDEKGMALYLFNKDAGRDSVCFGQCLAIWPIYYAENLSLPAELNRADFGEITRSDGKKQTTYRGWPVYYYFNDKNPGEINGEGVNNVWYVLKRDYSVLFASTQNNYLTDDRGMTLYYFKNDKANTSVCAGDCLANWPVFYAPNLVIPTTVLAKADFGEITRADGAKQSTFRGWPVYYFVNDTAKGDKKGEGVGGVWFSIDPAALQQAAQ